MPELVKDRPLRVFMTADAVSGVWTYCMDLARGLATRGVETTIAVFGPPTSRAQRREAHAIDMLELIETGLELDWTATSHGDCLRAAERAADLASFPTADVIQINGAALALPAFTNIPTIVVHHSCLATRWRATGDGPFPHDLLWRIALNGEALHHAYRVVAPTRAMAVDMVDTYDLHTMPVVIRSGRGRTGRALAEDMTENMAENLAEAVFTDGRLWDRAKDIATLDRAAARLPFTIYAAGSSRGPLGQTVDLRHVEQLGVIAPEEKRIWLSQRPIYVSTAIYEPFSLDVIDAAQAGCALVLADTPSLRELWDGAAVFTPQGDDAALAETLRELWVQPDQREALGQRAAARAATYSLDSMVDRMLALYLQFAPEPAELIGQGAL